MKTTVLVLIAATAVAGCTGTSSSPRASSSPAPTPTSASPASQPPSASASPTPSATEPSGPPAPEGFRATDVTFVSASEGWAIGRDGLVKTTDGGNTWTRLAAPPDGTRRVRFANSTTGYAWRPQHPLWLTTDGGATWRPGGLRRVYAVEIAGADAWALSGPLPYSDVRLAVVGSASWRKLGNAPDRGATLDVHGTLAYVTGQQGAGPIAPSLDVWSTDGSFHHEPLPCVKHDVIPWSPLGVSTDGSLVLDCDVEAPHDEHQAFYTSTDEGRSWTQVAAPRMLPDDVTAINGGRFSFGHGIYADSGAGWQQVLPPSGARHFRTAGFQDDGHGIALTRSGGLYRTIDGGRIWNRLSDL